MGCFLTVIASYNTGHKDILSENTAVLLTDQRPLAIKNPDGSLYSNWYEPNLDEVISQLEWAYENRESLAGIGSAGSGSISSFTWDRAAGEFYNLLWSH